MKIACICNMNNMMFILCRYLRDAGYDAQLFTLADEPAHFNPASDSYDDEYLTYYHPFPFTKSTIYKPESIQLLHKKLKDFDFFIGSDMAPAILAMIGLRLDVFVPHGSDIYDFPFKKNRPKNVSRSWWLNEKETLRKLQVIEIEHTVDILFPDGYDEKFSFKKSLKTGATYHNTSGPMVYSDQYDQKLTSLTSDEFEYLDFFKNLKKEVDLLLFYHGRHNDPDPSMENAVYGKGTDVLIRGFASFLNQNPQLKCRLVFFKYGTSIAYSESLIHELGLEKHIIWLPLMPRKEIMLYLSFADITCGHFKNSWLTCGVINESLALNKPILTYRQDQLYADDYPDLYPILNAQNETDIAQRLNEFIEQSEKIIDKSKKGVVWLDKYTVQKPLQIVKKAITDKEPSSKQLPSDTIKKTQEILKKHYRKSLLLRSIEKLENIFRK